MPKMSPDTLKALLAAERSDALASAQASKLSSEREAALSYYMGDVSADMPNVDGRSRAVSFDVSDTVEGMMPQLMEIFCSGDEVVRFDPVGKEDVQAAEQESDYVNFVFMQKNPGFMALYSMVKDALLSKVGIVKIHWKTDEAEERRTFENLDDDQYMMIVSDPEVEVIEHTMKDAPGDEANA